MSEPGIELRRAGPDDVAVVAALMRKMLEEMSSWGPDAPSADPAAWEAHARVLAQDLASDEHSIALAGEGTGMVAARLERAHPLFVPAKRLHISAVWVEPGARRQGLARRLLEHAFAWGRAQGCTAVQLNVLLPNPARELYRALGFEELRVEMRRDL